MGVNVVRTVFDQTAVLDEIHCSTRRRSTNRADLAAYENYWS